MPIIGSDLGGIPELIDDGKNGFIFKHNDEMDLNSKLKQINSLKDDELEMMKKASRDKFESNYTDNQHYAQIIKIYNEALERRQ